MLSRLLNTCISIISVFYFYIFQGLILLFFYILMLPSCCSSKYKRKIQTKCNKVMHWFEC